MLEYSTYSVISPEGCASILWKDADKASSAAEAMKLTSVELKHRQLVDEVVAEPLGGAHRDFDAVAESIRAAVERHLDELVGIGIDDLLEQRYRRIQSFGRYSERN
jgi:acetyl-CoA carboxylase carboxyl transferase subunit alpha